MRLLILAFLFNYEFFPLFIFQFVSFLLFIIASESEDEMESHYPSLKQTFCREKIWNTSSFRVPEPVVPPSAPMWS